MKGHAGFAVLNRTGNPVVRALLRSPLHPLLSRNLALVTYTGRRTGQEHTIPVGYRLEDGFVTIVVGAPERKRWWRNLRGGAPVRLTVRGAERHGLAHVDGDERAGVRIRVRLDQPGPR